MDLENSLALLERKKTELQEEYEIIKKELEHILFDLPFDYQKVFMGESDKYFIYPCIDASKHYKSISEKYKKYSKCITKTYFVYSPIQKETVKVVETATLEKKTANFKLFEFDVEFTSTIITKIRYTLKLGDFEFSFSKNFFQSDFLKYYDEKLDLKDLKESFESVIERNAKIENNFLSNISPFHFNKEVTYSLSQYINKYIETGKKIFFIHFDSRVICKIEFDSFIKDIPLEYNLHCNESSIALYGKFEVVNYSARVFLATLTDRKKISDFSDSWYGAIKTQLPNEEIEIRKLFLN